MVAIEHIYADRPLVDPTWPLRDLSLKKCITFWSEVLLTQFGSHRALLRLANWPLVDPDLPMRDICPGNTLRPGLGFFRSHLEAIGHFQANWPLVHPSRPLHDLWSQQCTTLYYGFDLWMIIDLTSCGVALKVCSQTSDACIYPHANFQLRTSKHNETQSWTYSHTDPIF